MNTIINRPFPSQANTLGEYPAAQRMERDIDQIPVATIVIWMNEGTYLSSAVHREMIIDRLLYYYSVLFKLRSKA